MATSTWFVLAVTAAYGLVIGSFLNVVIYRLPRGQSLLRPRSSCPACGVAIAWYDNVPVLSYLALAGRCRHCRTAISPRYPLVELASAGLLVGVLWQFGFSFSVQSVSIGIFVLLLLALAIIDLEHFLLLDWLTLPGLALGVLAAPLIATFAGSADQTVLGKLGGLIFPGWGDAPSAFLGALLGAALGALIPYLIGQVWERLFHKEGMGFGDVKFLAMIGAFLGWKGVLLTIGLGSVLGAGVGVAMIATGRGRRDTELPFGTFLAAGALLTLFVGPALMRALKWIRP
jgi:leader peptidase (prepilin peptidase)/N-methyltransferase